MKVVKILTAAMWGSPPWWIAQIYFTAEVTHDEKVTFNSSGSSTRNIRLRLDQVGARRV